MFRLRLALIVVLLIATSGMASGGDLLDQALSTVGKSKADLGYHPKGYWNRYPYEIPFDVGGKDSYFDYVDSTKTTLPRTGCTDNASWYRPARDSKNFGFDNYGIGIDSDSGTVVEMFILEKKD